MWELRSRKTPTLTLGQQRARGRPVRTNHPCCRSCAPVPDIEPRAGVYAGWKEGDKRRYGIVLSVDPSGAMWLPRLHRPWRRCRRSPDDTTLLASLPDTQTALDQLAVDFARNH